MSEPMTAAEIAAASKRRWYEGKQRAALTEALFALQAYKMGESGNCCWYGWQATEILSTTPVWEQDQHPHLPWEDIREMARGLTDHYERHLEVDLVGYEAWVADLMPQIIEPLRPLHPDVRVVGMAL